MLLSQRQALTQGPGCSALCLGHRCALLPADGASGDGTALKGTFAPHFEWPHVKSGR